MLLSTVILCFSIINNCLLHHLNPLFFRPRLHKTGKVITPNFCLLSPGWLNNVFHRLKRFKVRSIPRLVLATRIQCRVGSEVLEINAYR
ncbi:hypothetical protein F5X96DRAFT_275494 [Biscogniauxia mediterranea]|nr:hypothetical protein F5X96DRAFT_275494 [Biscogniauxia mediterranea]